MMSTSNGLKVTAVICSLLVLMAGILLGLYVGIYLCLYGGMAQIVKGFTAIPVSASEIAWGIVRVALTSVAGWAIVIFFGLVSYVLAAISEE